MKVVFETTDSIGEAEYDPSTEKYSWSYDGENQKIVNVLFDLEDGKLFTDMDTGVADTDGEELIVGEQIVEVPWEQQIERLAISIRQRGAEIKYVGE